MVTKLIGLGTAYSIVEEAYKNAVKKNGIVPKKEDIKLLEKIMRRNFYDILNNDTCESIEIKLEGKDSGTIYDMGHLADVGDKIEMHISDKVYSLEKKWLKYIQICGEEDLKFKEDKGGLWTRCFSISSEAKRFVKDIYENTTK